MHTHLSRNLQTSATAVLFSEFASEIFSRLLLCYWHIKSHLSMMNLSETVYFPGQSYIRVSC